MTDRRVALSLNDWAAVIFDLDGVITRTASVHAAAWKSLFDAFLDDREARDGEDHSPFDADRDYRRYVDGKPRYQGVQSFLESRGIELPWGEAHDPPGSATVCALGNRKNELFNQRLHEDGVEVFPHAVELVTTLRSEGVPTAIVSSSKNTRAVLEAAELEGLFDAVVDGVEADRLGLEGKPAPDVFVEAAARLGAEPARSIVVEDAVSGVEAGRRGGFGLVVGVDRSGRDGRQLRDAGADEVVRDLAALDVGGGRRMATGSYPLPSAFDLIDSITALVADGGRLAVFLDYDGTLTPIVERPENAVLPEATREALVRLAAVCPVAVVSGRDLADVRSMVGVDGLVYAGSHGFDIAGPDTTAERATEYLPDLDRAETELSGELEGIDGAWVERKKFAVAVHFRQVDEANEDDVRRAVEEVHHRHEDRLKMSGGKKIFELRPAVDWHKGRALAWLLGELGLDGPDTLPMYIGDDVTDEDAFRELGDRGLAILVGEGAGPTFADHRLVDPDEVRLFLVQVAEAVGGGRS
ncbi:MAG TPA: trehalose-phosphatase [Candidatus Sulfomarinibacteraceae bacterium]|nr:trehalose-phosphatase [Candidatus Sulfomarinibacteraceae bacterium]